MNAPKPYTTEIICLKSYQYGEADRILHCLSEDYGRISVIAKGVRKATSKLAGACEPMNVSQVQLIHGQSLHRLTQYQPLATFAGIRSDVLKLAYAQLFLELVSLVTMENDADSHTLYRVLKDGLQCLNDAPDEGAMLQMAVSFQLAVLDAAGYHPNLSYCQITEEPIDPEQLYYCFSPATGGVFHPEQRSLHSGRWVNVSTSTLSVLASIAEDSLTEQQWKKANVVKIQKFLRFYYEEILEKTLQSMDFVLSLLEPQGVSEVSL